MAAHHLLCFLILLNYFPLLHFSAANDDQIKFPEPFHCGNLGLVLFPFTQIGSDYGLCISGCDNNPYEVKQVHFENQTYKIESIFQDGHKSLLILETNTTKSFWEVPMMSLHSINRVYFLRKKTNPYGDWQEPRNMSLYKSCPPYKFYYHSENGVLEDDMYPSLLTACSSISLPQSEGVLDSTSLRSFVEIEVKLNESSEECYYGRCPCRFDQTGFHCVHHHENNGSEKIGLSIGLAITSTIALCAILLLYKRRHDSSENQNKTRNIIYSNPNSNAITIPESGNNVYFGIPVFSYEELQEATNNFDQARELGEGGFGTVYYGKLRDGRGVAVKRLYERNYRPVESFINEIQILTRLRHSNLVSLFGCTSRHSRELLLVYEYVPNGTLSYHLHGDKSKSKLLPWPVRMKIAIETATALVYLHDSDIIHRDVKTSNILLDNNFSVKVADFGLSRLFPDDVTHISTAPRGTPGYVDPDYRLCYQLTSKSDVYSFGVVLVELISSLPAVDMNREHDEIKLANLALRKIQKGAFCELGDPNLGFQSDGKSRRMMISVAKLAFQCLQGDKDLRPSMCEVLEVLQRIENGKDEPWNLEGIEVHGAGAGVGVSLGNSLPLLPHTLIKPKRLHQTL